jgi:hypothetical protein
VILHERLARSNVILSASEESSIVWFPPGPAPRLTPILRKLRMTGVAFAATKQTFVNQSGRVFPTTVLE